MRRKRLKRVDETKLTRHIENKLHKRIDLISPSRMQRGGFYTFEYISKLYEEDKLDFFDRQPLILCIDKNDEYMLGINFHYINTTAREKVINRLKKMYKNQWDTNKLLPNVSWDKFKKEMKYANFMVKLYIIENVVTSSRIKNVDMEKYIDLPSQDFIGIKADALWKSLGM